MTQPLAQAPALTPMPARALILSVRVMTCAACASRIEKGLGARDGVLAATVNLVLERADVAIDPSRTNIDAVVAAVREIGYEAAPIDAEKPLIEDHGRPNVAAGGANDCAYI